MNPLAADGAQKRRLSKSLKSNSARKSKHVGDSPLRSSTYQRMPAAPEHGNGTASLYETLSTEAKGGTPQRRYAQGAALPQRPSQYSGLRPGDAYASPHSTYDTISSDSSFQTERSLAPSTMYVTAPQQQLLAAQRQSNMRNVKAHAAYDSVHTANANARKKKEIEVKKKRMTI